MALRDSGTLGKIKTIKAEFSVTIPFDAKNIRHDPAAGGGALMDLGCYPVHWVRLLAGEEPDIVVAASGTRTQLGVDESHHRDAALSERHLRRRHVRHGQGHAVQGAAFRHVASTAPSRSRTRFSRIAATRSANGSAAASASIPSPAARPTTHQLQALLDTLDGKAHPFNGGADAIGNMTVIDEIYEKAGFR